MYDEVRKFQSTKDQMSSIEKSAALPASSWIFRLVEAFRACTDPSGLCISAGYKHIVNAMQHAQRSGDSAVSSQNRGLGPASTGCDGRVSNLSGHGVITCQRTGQA